MGIEQESEQNDRPKCSYCKNDGQVSHPCPFAEEIHDNYDPEFCNCCEACTHDCAMDV